METGSFIRRPKTADGYSVRPAWWDDCIDEKENASNGGMASHNQVPALSAQSVHEYFKGELEILGCMSCLLCATIHLLRRMHMCHKILPWLAAAKVADDEQRFWIFSRDVESSNWVACQCRGKIFHCSNLTEQHLWAVSWLDPRTIAYCSRLLLAHYDT